MTGLRARRGDKVVPLPERLDRIELRQNVHTLALAVLVAEHLPSLLGLLAGSSGSLLGLLGRLV